MKSRRDARVPIIREGVLADAWWNYHWWPAYADDGTIGGVLLGFIETTTQMEATAVRELAAAHRR